MEMKIDTRSKVVTLKKWQLLLLTWGGFAAFYFASLALLNGSYVLAIATKNALDVSLLINFYAFIGGVASVSLVLLVVTSVEKVKLPKSLDLFFLVLFIAAVMAFQLPYAEYMRG